MENCVIQEREEIISVKECSSRQEFVESSVHAEELSLEADCSSVVTGGNMEYRSDEGILANLMKGECRSFFWLLLFSYWNKEQIYYASWSIQRLFSEWKRSEWEDQGRDAQDLRE